MKRIRSAAWALCLLWALLLCAGAYAEAFPALGVPAPDAARPPHSGWRVRGCCASSTGKRKKLPELHGTPARISWARRRRP